MAKTSKQASKDAPLLTLAELAGKLPKPDAADREALVEDSTREALIEAGRKIASQRIVVDAQRIYNTAYQFWRGANDAQKTVLVGFTPELLSLAVGEAITLDQMDVSAAAQNQRASATAAGAQGARAIVMARATAMRDQATVTLRTIAAHNKTWTERVDAAHARADVMTAIDALAGVAKDMLAQKNTRLATRCKLHGLSAGYVDGLVAAAKSARTSMQEHVGRTPHGVSQGALDFEDGINLHLLGAIVHAFEAAHDLDATIPRLVPISTRRLLGSHHAAGKLVAPPPPAVAAAAVAPS